MDRDAIGTAKEARNARATPAYRRRHRLGPSGADLEAERQRKRKETASKKRENVSGRRARAFQLVPLLQVGSGSDGRNISQSLSIVKRRVRFAKVFGAEGNIWRGLRMRGGKSVTLFLLHVLRIR